MDASYLSQQVNTIIGQLHGLFDEIGVGSHDRESREAELFAALSETLNNQVKQVTAEKKGLVEEAQRIITTIRQMEASLDGARSQNNYDDDDLRITYPLTRCLPMLKEKHKQISKLHRERFEQVKKLVQALESYSSHLEPSFVQIALPPTGQNQSIPPTFDISPAYVNELDDEFTRVYEEYTRRVSTVKAICEHIIQLWAELGTPQAQTDGTIVKYYRDAPEQLGLHEEDLSRLRNKRDKLADEKKNREKRLKDLKVSVEALWDKLGVEESERRAFLNGNRGCGVRQINEFEDELARLNELKRQNLHLFVEDARCKLQELWDALYFSEDEMLEFTPAFSDVYSDALLEAHEREITRLDTLREQRAPTLALVEKHRTLVHERDELAASSQDASRLMMRGQKGERRDPGKLLREEKMRKRITKELPKIAAELVKLLEKWEDEYGRPFLVHGERYLDLLEPEAPKQAPGPRSKTPAGPPPSANRGIQRAAAPPSRGNSTATKGAAIIRSKTPTANMNGNGNGNGTIKRTPGPGHIPKDSKSSPTKIPARVPLSNLKHGSNSPERPRPDSRAQGVLRVGPPLTRAPPPKMRELGPPPELETPTNPYRNVGLGSGSFVRAVDPEDVYNDQVFDDAPYKQSSYQIYAKSQPHHNLQMAIHSERLAQSAYPQAPPPRQISNTSTAVSGSENWETYDDNSEPEEDASDAYYAKVRAARGKRFTPENGYPNPQANQPKRQRGIPPAAHTGDVVDAEGNRIISGSEWTDEDAY
ncbi:microtubule associated protein-domain-containing protein [Annulohypoxylon maeteangense]|uniref:microtubule associated protein-domain-containing protein n=1 Tax=Annulohypoxylon maeteangense TaxID=1927788 RepID=UPI0020074A1B|nr:microtubule associated protein-domain-containing protein [Annulohypoxylon maeteangense]KAI0887549.1 microtubule associated protein-domain-containing protein [Annulohypoxylon maeteangense]